MVYSVKGDDELRELVNDARLKVLKESPKTKRFDKYILKYVIKKYLGASNGKTK